VGWPVHVADIAAQGGTSCVGEGSVAGDGLGLALGVDDGEGDGEGDGLLLTVAVGVDPHAETTITAASASSPTLRLTGHSNEEAWWEVTDLRRQGTGAQGYGETGAGETDEFAAGPSSNPTNEQAECARTPVRLYSGARVHPRRPRHAIGGAMTTVRLLVGTHKGAFILTSDERRERWNVDGPQFTGWDVYHVKGSSVDPNRVYASQSRGWFGQVVQRSDDGGKSWEPAGNEFKYEGAINTHKWYDNSDHPYDFTRVWHLEPSLTDADTVYAGVEDAALFKSTDAGKSWEELDALRHHPTAPSWAPGAGGLCLHTIIQDPKNPDRLVTAISSAGAFRTDDGGKTWAPINKGLRSNYIPDEDAEVGHCVHHIAMHPSRPNVLFMQKHWDVMRSDNGGDSWTEVSGNLPTDFGFVIDVHAHEPETIYVVPIKSDSDHFVPDGKLRVYRSRSGGNEWEALTKGLPQKDCYVNVLRDAMTVDNLESCGVYFGTTAGEVYASNDAGDSWKPIVQNLPAVLSVEVQTLA